MSLIQYNFLNNHQKHYYYNINLIVIQIGLEKVKQYSHKKDNLKSNNKYL